jgi:multicomponent Na+:H+ antiporter subunit D
VAELLLHPVWPFVIGAVLVRVLPRQAGHVVMIAAPLVALAQVVTLGSDASVGFTYLDWDLVVLRADGLSQPFGWVFAIAALLAGIYGIASQRGPERSAALVYAGAAMGVVYAGDLLTFFVFWEIKAISSTFVILSRRTPLSGRAGIRYLFVHIVGGKILLAGILLHLADTGSLEFTSFEPGLASSLILIACLINAAVPPLHAWLPDAYPQASVAGTVFLSAYTTKAAVYALARGFPGFQILIYLGIFMALYGVVFAVLENDIRRLLGYHIVSQVGFMVAAVGIGTEVAINGATAHAFAHIIYKGLLLMGVGSVLYATGRSKASALGGIANRMRPVLVLYMVGAVSISGFPLFSGFVSKELVVDAAYLSDLTWLVLLLKVASVGTFLSTGLKLPYATWFGEPGVGPRGNEGAPFHVARIPASMYVAMGLAAGLNLAMGLFPGLLYALMPFPVEYVPYRFGKVVETLQVLAFTGLGFWLLLARLGAKDYVTVDTDWPYRKMPTLLFGRLGRGDVGTVAPSDRAPSDAVLVGSAGSDPAPAEAGEPVPQLAGPAPNPIGRLFTPRTGPPPVTGTWALGAVVLGAGALLLLLSLLS